MPDPTERLNKALEGRYRIERELGEGGMATVYLAEDLKHERKVALKVLKPELAAAVGAERFLAEIKVTANQAGSGQAQYDVSTDDERFVMLKFAGGESQLILVENFFEVLEERVPN